MKDFMFDFEIFAGRIKNKIEAQLNIKNQKFIYVISYEVRT